MVVLTGVLALGAGMGFLLWDSLTLPFHNPGHIVGICSQLQFNPLNDLVRSLVLCLLPSVLLTALYFAGSRRWRDRLFKPSPAMAPKKEKGGGTTRAVWVFLLAAYAVLLALNVPTYHASGRFDFFHEGESLGAAVSYLHGLTPYRDFLFFHGFFQDPFRCAVAFKLFGKSIGAVRTLESLGKIAAWLLMALCLKRFFRQGIVYAFGAISILALAYVSFLFTTFMTTFLPRQTPDAMVLEFLKDLPYLSPFEFLIVPARDVTTYLFIFTLAGVAAYLEHGKGSFPRGLFFLLSFTPVAALAYAVDRGIFLCAAYAVLMPCLYLMFFKGKPLERRFFAWSFLGLLGALLVLALAFQGGFFDFFQYVFGTMPFYKALSEKIPLPAHQWHFMALGFLFAAQLYYWVYRFLAAGKRADFLRAEFLETSLLVLSFAFGLGILERSDWEHAIYCAGPLYLLTFRVAARKLLPPLLAMGWPRRILEGGALGLTILLAVLCAVRTVRLDVVRKNFPLAIPDSEMFTEGQKATAAFLSGQLKAGEKFFTLTSEAGWYYLLDQPCPTRFPYIWVAAPEAYQEEIVQNLEAQKVKWVLFKDGDWSYQMDGISNEEKFPILVRFIRERYEPYKTIAGNEIWVLKQGS